MNLRDIALEALGYIKPSNTANNQATLALASSRQKERLAADATATLQDIFRAASSFYRKPMAATLPAPSTISVDVTSGSQTFTSGATIPQGSTIVIDGDTVFNQARASGGTKSLLFPFRGTTGTRSATLYGDVVVLDARVAKVIGHCRLSDGGEVKKAVNPVDLYRFCFEREDYGRRFRSAISTPISGVPQKYWVSADLFGASDASTTILRVNPMPTAAVGISFMVQIKAPRILVANLGDDATPSTFDLVIPEDAIESLFKPIFLLKWSGSPWWEDEDSKRRIKEAAGPALKWLEDYRMFEAGERQFAPTL